MNYQIQILFSTRRTLNLAIRFWAMLGMLASLGLYCANSNAAETSVETSAIVNAPAAQGVREVTDAAKSLSRGAPVPSWVDTSLKTPETTVQGPLVVRLSDFQAYVDKESAIYIHRMTQANEASMLSTVGRIEIAFQPEYQQVALHALHIIRGTSVIDKTNVAQIRFLQREQELNDDVITGLITASIVIDDIRVGDTLDISYSITGQNPVFGGKFFHSVAWDNIWPTERKRVILNTSVDRPIFHRVIGEGHEIQVREQKSGTRVITRLYAENLLAVDDEPYTPDDVDSFREIQFSEFKTWQQVAQWATSLFDVNTSPASLDEITAPMLNSADADATVQNALTYVQNEIRYLSVSLGENSHKPFPPELVLARRYGDCKDKALLLATLLNHLGIDASPVLVSATSPKRLDRYLPTPQVFDHAIVRTVVNGTTYFIDPTRISQYGPLASMGQGLPGAQALVIRPDTEKLVVIPPIATNADPSNFRTEHMIVRKIDEPADLIVRHQYSRLQAEGVRYYIGRQTKEQLRKLYMSAIVRRYPNAELLSGPIVTDNRKNNTLSIEMHYRVPGALEKTSKGWLFRYQASNLTERFFLPQNPRRMFPLTVPVEPAVSRYEMELVLPNDFDADYKPTDNTVKNSGYVAREMIDFKGHVLHASVNLNILNDRIPARDVPAFMKDSHRFDDMIESSVQIHRSDLKEGSVSALVDIPLKQRLAEQYAATIATTSTTISEGHAAGNPVADALCERGVNYARLGKKQEAQADIDAAIGEGKPSKELLRCKAQIAYFAGDMKAAEADFTHAIAQGDTDPNTFFEHAMSYYELAKWREAAEEFNHAEEGFSDVQDKSRADVMRMISTHRLDAPNRVGVQVNESSDWHTVVLAAIEGSKSDEDVLRAVHRLKEDNLEYALAEAYYYLAQINQLSGNKIKAMVYLQRSADKGIVSSDYNSAARIESENLHR